MKRLLLAMTLLFITLATMAAEPVQSTLSWVPPTEYTDGSVLNPEDIDVYRVYYTDDGTSPVPSSTTIDVPAPSSTYVHSFNLEPAPTIYQYNYTITTVLKDGRESEMSTIGSKQFLVKSSAKPNAPTLLGVE